VLFIILTLTVADKYQSIEQVQVALRAAGLESSSLIIGIDYTKSNECTGQRTFAGRSLHALSAHFKNPYQRVIEILGRTLEPFDDDKMIPVFGFGDSMTTNRSVFPFFPNRLCHTFKEAVNRYNEITPLITLAGPTNFAPLIYQAIHIVKQTRSVRRDIASPTFLPSLVSSTFLLSLQMGKLLMKQRRGLPLWKRLIIP
jgi:E3 ubiquitin-protein ligase RGLG